MAPPGRRPHHPVVIARAGSSDVGNELGVRTAEMTFTPRAAVKDGRAFHIKCSRERRVTDVGRIN